MLVVLVVLCGTACGRDVTGPRNTDCLKTTTALVDGHPRVVLWVAYPDSLKRYCDGGTG